VRYRFGEFALESATRRLLRGDREIRLSPKAFDLLLFLVANSSRALPKADLHQQLCPSTFVVDTTLAGLIAEVRQALGDSAEEPRYVRTMHRFGYWFVGDVREEGVPDGRLPAVRCWLFWDSRQIALIEGDNLIGRAQDAAVWVDARGISRHHARIRLDGQVATIEDLGSKNGTYVAGQPVTAPMRLADGDEIRLGSVVLTFRVPPPAFATDTAAPAHR
jgi:DNA-binding winged helix-turn-helix (wHTH) protein